MKITVDIENIQENDGLVVSSRFPCKKQSGWWLLIGDYNSNALVSIKKLGKIPKVRFSIYAKHFRYILRL